MAETSWEQRYLEANLRRGQLMWAVAPLKNDDNKQNNVDTSICNGPQLVPDLLQPIIHIIISHSAVSVIPLLSYFSVSFVQYGWETVIIQINSSSSSSSSTCSLFPCCTFRRRVASSSQPSRQQQRRQLPHVCFLIYPRPFSYRVLPNLVFPTCLGFLLF
jgi:hypothetical protein